jgi:hypothetical protein
MAFIPKKSIPVPADGDHDLRILREECVKICANMKFILPRLCKESVAG